MANIQELCVIDNLDVNTLSNEIRLIIDEPDESIVTVPVIDDKSRTQAFGIADTIKTETRKLWSSKKVIFDELKKLNDINSFNFIGYMLTIADSRTVLGDVRKNITNAGLRHIVSSFLNQAEKYNMNNTIEYKKLKKEYYLISRVAASSANKIVDKKIIAETNILLEDLYLEMTKVVY